MIDVDYNEYKKTIAQNMELIQENYKLKQKYNIMKENAETLAKRIDKAIEYIEKYIYIQPNEYGELIADATKLLEILKGENKE